MKMTDDDFKTLRSALEPLDTEERRARYRAGEFKRSELVTDLNKRYRWDLVWWFLVGDPDNDDFLHVLYYAGYNTSHITTALARIVPPL